MISALRKIAVADRLLGAALRSTGVPDQRSDTRFRAERDPPAIALAVIFTLIEILLLLSLIGVADFPLRRGTR